MENSILPKSRIINVRHVEDWREAVKITVKLLIDEGVVKEGFERLVIDNIEKYGPYIVIANEFALPHAVSKELVNEVGFSMLICDECVDLMGKDVRVFLTMATPDKHEHIAYLSNIAEILSYDDNFEILFGGDIERIYGLFEGIGGI